jgi:hypothetical protein
MYTSVNNPHKGGDDDDDDDNDDDDDDDNDNNNSVTISSRCRYNTKDSHSHLTTYAITDLKKTIFIVNLEKRLNQLPTK